MKLGQMALSLVLGMWSCGLSAQVEPMGTKSYGPLVVGGEDADKRTSTYMVALLREGLDFPGGFLCGATVVADGWVLTAAHCLYDGECNLRKFTTLYAISGYAQLKPGLPKLNATAVRPHSGFQCMPVGEQTAAVRSGKPIPMGNDIGLVRVAGGRLSQPALFIPTDSAAAAVAPLIASGWGTLGNSGAPSSELQSVNLTAVAQNVCDQAWAPSSLAADQLCIGAPAQSPARGICSGDSGGPLVGTLGSNRFQAGIVSLGHLVCSNVDRPSMFTNVMVHRAWIEGVIGQGRLPVVTVGCTPADIAAWRC
ncbi:hypothetical protein AE621_28075 [Acidovorax sp. SD340]|nr:hypothetical protein AE621_28075 [Acidovorax sp. SD340]